MVVNAFASFNKAHRALSDELQRRAQRALGGFIGMCEDIDELAQFVERTVPEKLASRRPIRPVLSEPVLNKTTEGEWTPWDASGSRERTIRHSISLSVSGTAELLEYWPDQSDQGIKPIDEHILDLAGGWDELATLDRDTQDEFDAIGRQWVLDERDHLGESQWTLSTSVDLTREQEGQAVAGVLDLQKIFDDRLSQITPIVKAIGDQIDSYWDQDLPARIDELVTDKREELETRAKLMGSLHFRPGWSVPEPQVVVSDLNAETDNAQGDPDAEHGETSGGNVSIDVRAKLDPATFTDVQRVIRTWADAVERYPDAFALHEDRVSDLLCATLNATVPGAGREVYTRRGKSDIFIQADVIRQGAGPATVFICESKWARGSDVVRKALDPQLFSYMNVHDTSAVLLLLQPQIGFDGGQQMSLSALRSVPGLVEETESSVDGWPLLRFERSGRSLAICVAFVHLPGG